DCCRLGARVGERDREMAKPEQFCPGFRGVMQDQDGLATAVRKRLDVAPAHAADARPQGLHRGFFSGEPGRQLGWAVPVALALSLGVDAVEEALAVPLEDAGDALDLDDVNPYFNRPGGFRVPERLVGVICQLRHM